MNTNVLRLVDQEVQTRNDMFARRKAEQDMLLKTKAQRSKAIMNALEVCKDASDILNLMAGMESPLAKYLNRGIQFAAGRQLMAYIQNEPDRLPEMGIRDIEMLELDYKLELLMPTYEFLGVEGKRALSPKRPQVNIGKEAAAYILLTDAVLGIQNPRIYANDDAMLAKTLNRVIGCTLQFKEPHETAQVYDWDASPVADMDTQEERQNNNPEQDNGQDYDWD